MSACAASFTSLYMCTVSSASCSSFSTVLQTDVCVTGAPEARGKRKRRRAQQTQSARRGQQQSRSQPVWHAPARRPRRMSRAAAHCTLQLARSCGSPDSEHEKGEQEEKAMRVGMHTGPKHGRRRTGWTLRGPASSASGCRTGTAAQARSPKSFAHTQDCARVVEIVCVVRAKKKKGRGKKNRKRGNGFRRRRRQGTQPWARGPPTPWRRGR